MHHLKTLILGVSIILTTLASCQFNITRNEGKGPLTDKVYSYTFSGIKQATGLESKVFKSNESKVVVNAPADIMDKILVEMIEDNTIFIHVKKNSNISTNKVSISIYTPQLSKIDASSASEVLVKDTFTTEKLSLESSSGARIDGFFKSLSSQLKSSSGSEMNLQIFNETADVQSSSGASIVLKGLGKTSHLKSSSGAKIDAENYTSQESIAESSSGADISIGTTNIAKAKASSGSRVDIYKKNNSLELTKEESSGGQVSVH